MTRKNIVRVTPLVDEESILQFRWTISLLFVQWNSESHFSWKGFEPLCSTP